MKNCLFASALLNDDSLLPAEDKIKQRFYLPLNGEIRTVFLSAA